MIDIINWRSILCKNTNTCCRHVFNWVSRDHPKSR